jgi:hypothetical protein
MFEIQEDCTRGAQISYALNGQEGIPHHLTIVHILKIYTGNKTDCSGFAGHMFQILLLFLHIYTIIRPCHFTQTPHISYAYNTDLW